MFTIERLFDRAHLTTVIRMPSRRLTDDEIAHAAQLYEKGESLARIAAAFDCSTEPIRRRLKEAGVTMRIRTYLVTVWGETKAVAAWADDPRCTISEHALRQRIMNGWDAERAITQGPRSQILATAFGETKTVTEWANDPRCLVSRETIKGRLKAGWHPQRAVSQQLRTQPPRPR
jgi:hypothetical protein